MRWSTVGVVRLGRAWRARDVTRTGRARPVVRRNPWTRSLRRTSRVARGLLVALVLALAPSAVSGGSGLTSRPPSRAFSGTCSVPSPSPARVVECDALGVSAINQARATEGLGPLALPTGFSAESLDAQMLTLVNEERVDRGLAPVKGVSSFLDVAARAGARSGNPPVLPKGLAVGHSATLWSSVWSPILADYLFLYDDGEGGVNLDCVTHHLGPCWADRRALLASYPGPLLMGVGSSGRGGGVSGLGLVITGGDRLDRVNVVRWTSLRARLRPGVSMSALVLPGGHPATLLVGATGSAMTITVSTTSPAFSVAPSSCVLKAGATCSLRVVAAPGATSATLLVASAGGVSSVTLRSTTP